MTDVVGIVGLGYVGLPLAVQAAEKGKSVIGVDLNEELVHEINNRNSPFANDPRFESALCSLASSALVASTNFNELSNAEAILICVPTPTEQNTPDLGHVSSAVKQVGNIMRRGQLISLESTVYPGVTRNLVLPLIEDASGLKIIDDFNMTYCPERVDPGNSLFHVGNLNRVIGGVTKSCTSRGGAFYSEIIDAEIVELGSVEEAEFVKSWENVQRNIQIATANYAAMICDTLGLDFSRVQRGLQSKVDQFGLQLATPGIGPGGHCIPEDIHYVIDGARKNGMDTGLLDNSAEVNEKMPRYAVDELAKLVGIDGISLSEQKVALLGLSYKPGVNDTRRSPAIEVVKLLESRCREVVAHDPYATFENEDIEGVQITKTLEEALEGTDAIFIATGHDLYVNDITPEMLLSKGVRYVFDGRNCLNAIKLREAGLAYKGIGQ